MESAAEFFDTWMKSQQRFAENWMQAAMEQPLTPDKIFGFTPGVATEYMDQMIKITDAFRRSAEEFGQPWMKAMWNNAALPPEIMSGHPEVFLNMFHNMFNAFENTMGRVFHVPPIGKDREKLDLMQKTLDHLTVFCAKFTEYQYKICLTGIRAGEKVLEAVTQRVMKGEQIGSLNELFDLWIDVNEEEFLQVFRTEDFSRLQGELLEASLNLRRHFDQLMELYFSELPLALRSEMDDLYKTVYDLKKKVRGMERLTQARITEEAVA